MGEEVGIGDEMSQLDDIANLDTVTRLLRDWLGWDDLPHVVGVVVGVSSDLLALAGDSAIVVSQRVFVGVTVQVDLGLLVLDADVVVVVNRDSRLRHHVVAECRLELGAHEVVAGTRTRQDGEVDLEPEEVQKEWNHDKSSNTRDQVLAKVGQRKGALSPVDVKQRPQINGDWHTDGEESERADVFGGDDTAEADSGEKQPLPPLATEGLVTNLVEANVAPDGKSHEQDECGIEQDQASLANVCVVEKNESCSEDAGRKRVSRLPHDQEDDRDSESSHAGRHGAVCNVWDLV